MAAVRSCRVRRSTSTWSRAAPYTSRGTQGASTPPDASCRPLEGEGATTPRRPVHAAPQSTSRPCHPPVPCFSWTTPSACHGPTAVRRRCCLPTVGRGATAAKAAPTRRRSCRCTLLTTWRTWSGGSWTATATAATTTASTRCRPLAAAARCPGTHTAARSWCSTTSRTRCGLQRRWRRRSTTPRRRFPPSLR